ncbi:MAG: alpha/beta fold hydrolase [Phycisphaerae bacterium]|nr:alpha/beta fold hydrolase [Phycisphaerae bacterium]
MLTEDPRPATEQAPPLVLLHGFLGEPADWDAVVAALTVPRRVLRADLLRAATSAFDLASLARALADAINELVRAPVDIVGYSLGGRVALALLHDRPDCAEHVLAVSATPGIDNAQERLQRSSADDALADVLERDGLGAFIERWYAQPLFAALRSHPDFGVVSRRRAAGDGASWARILRDASPGRNRSLWSELRRMATTPSVTNRLSFAVGSLDAKYLDLSREVTERVPALRVDVIDGAGHAVHLERPAALAARIDALLH